MHALRLGLVFAGLLLLGAAGDTLLPIAPDSNRGVWWDHDTGAMQVEELTVRDGPVVSQKGYVDNSPDGQRGAFTGINTDTTVTSGSDGLTYQCRWVTGVTPARCQPLAVDQVGRIYPLSVQSHTFSVDGAGPTGVDATVHFLARAGGAAFVVDLDSVAAVVPISADGWVLDLRCAVPDGIGAGEADAGDTLELGVYHLAEGDAAGSEALVGSRLSFVQGATETGDPVTLNAIPGLGVVGVGYETTTDPNSNLDPDVVCVVRIAEPL